MEATLATPPYKLKVRLGENEFDAEGSETSVKEQYAAFLQLIQAIPIAKLTGRGVDRTAANNEGENDEDIERLWNRAYHRKEDRVSLLVLPQSKNPNPDAILLLLYGYNVLLNQDSVKSTDLMESAKQSGLRIDRIDRNLPTAYNAFIIKGGNGKGSRYSLNNRGLARAQELLDELFE